MQDEKKQTYAMEADVLDPELMAHAVLAREQCLEIQKEVFNSLSGWRALVMLSALLALKILLCYRFSKL